MCGVEGKGGRRREARGKKDGGVTFSEDRSRPAIRIADTTGLVLVLEPELALEPEPGLDYTPRQPLPDWAVGTHTAYQAGIDTAAACCQERPPDKRLVLRRSFEAEGLAVAAVVASCYMNGSKDVGERRRQINV